MYLILENENKHVKDYLFADTLMELIKKSKEINYSDKIVTASLHTYEDKLCCNELLLLKKSLVEFNVNLGCIISNKRESIISAKSLKINGIYSDKDYTNFDKKIDYKDIDQNLTHMGMVRSGDQISSNGNLIIIGDVNPGAQISAKKNIYVWGKLCGVAFAGKNGSNNSTIASLYLNALQLRINKTVAIGPKEKPKSNYPEIALIERGKIIIKPLLMSN